MALSDARNLALMQACLTCLAPRNHVEVDPLGTVSDEAALDLLEAEVTAAEQGAIDNDQRPAFKLVKNAPYTYGPMRVVLPALVIRITALNP